MTESASGPPNETAKDETPQDETKRKFREALERKKAKTAGAAAATDIGSPQSRAHGPQENRREFRRRSGG